MGGRSSFGRLGQRRQLDQPATAEKVAPRASACHLQAQARPAAATGADEREHAAQPQVLLDTLDLARSGIDCKLVAEIGK
jgi:hypothetical protein